MFLINLNLVVYSLFHKMQIFLGHLKNTFLNNTFTDIMDPIMNYSDSIFILLSSLTVLLSLIIRNFITLVYSYLFSFIIIYYHIFIFIKTHSNIIIVMIILL